MKKRLQGLILGIFIGVIIAGGVVFSQQINKTAELCYQNIKIFVDGEEFIPTDVQGDTIAKAKSVGLTPCKKCAQ